jgi:hypothetical protein
MSEQAPLVLTTAQDTLHFDPQSASLIALRPKATPEINLIAQASAPVFRLQYLDEKLRFRQLSSQDASATTIEVEGQSQQLLTAHFRQVGGHNLDVTITVRTDVDDPCSHWSIRVHNKAGLLITDVHFPFVLAPYKLGEGDTALVWPFGSGILFRNPQPDDLKPDNPHTWQMRPENGGASHYPGLTVAQFLACYGERNGIYVACHDTEGYVKLVRPLHYAPGCCRLGIAHLGDWPEQGERTLEYDIVVRSFTGDWYAAAAIYREWSLQQPWARTPLHRRTDVPGWLLDSPPHIVVRIQGQLDLGPAEPNEAFLPYPKILPLLEQLSNRIGAPVLPVIMSWERYGPWIYPNCFPPAGGAESLREFSAAARERGWHIGTFCNGTRWVIGHYWSGYDGEDDFYAQGGDRSVCQTHTGELWRENWDVAWRPSFTSCVGTSMTRQIAVDFVDTVIGYGLDWIQFFDQNVGVSTFPCYARDHEHPPVPGRWMTERMQDVIAQFYKLAHAAVERSGGAREIVFSVETPANEFYLQEFQICDVRVLPEGHVEPFHLRGFIPLYHFLYHEFILMQGGFGTGPEPYHLPIKNAYNWAIGEIPGAVLQADGMLMNKDSAGINWAPWDQPVGSNDDSLELLRTTTALRRGAAQPFLVYGRMQPPARVEGIRTIRWQRDGSDHQIPAIYHSVWQAPDGRLGWTLANWTNEPQTVSVHDPRLGNQVTEHVVGRTAMSQSRQCADGSLQVELPPLGCLLLAH